MCNFSLDNAGSSMTLASLEAFASRTTSSHLMIK